MSLVQVDRDNWINKDDISSLTIVRDNDTKVSVVIYVGRRTLSVDVRRADLEVFIEGLK